MKPLRERRKRTRSMGTASVEILVMLPVFVLLLASVFYVHRLGMASQTAASSARSCAWTFALKGCPEKLPDVCSGLGPGAESEGESPKELEGTSWFDGLDGIPVLGFAVRQVFGHGKRMGASRTAPFLDGETEVKVSSTQYVLCNSVAESWSGKIQDFLDYVTDWE